MQKIVLDSSVLVEGFIISGNYEYYVTKSVIEELKSKLSEDKVESLTALGLKVKEPSESAIKKVENTASGMGETPRLSNTDIEVLALAIELDAVILTDDYSIQNVAKELGIEYLPFAQKGITEKIVWKYKCAGCGKYFQNFLPICPICGKKLKTVR
jgi:UPF0271 protein